MLPTVCIIYTKVRRYYEIPILTEYSPRKIPPIHGRLGHNMVYALLKSGKLKGYRCGRIWRIPKAALVEYVREQSGIGREQPM